MKNKIVTIILGIALLLSAGGNIYLVKTMTDAKGEVNALSDQLVTANNQIADLQEQLTDLSALQAQVNDLQGQLTQSNTQIENLETTIAENNTTISDLEEQLAEQEQLLSESQEQTQPLINQSATNTGTTSTSNTQTEQPSANPENTPTDNVSNQGDGRDNSTNPGLVTEPNGDVHPQVGHRWDDNDPSFPVYEGPKEGYNWNNALGYVPSNGGTGTTQTGNDMAGDQSACVFDENGNCTVHQHSGY